MGEGCVLRYWADAEVAQLVEQRTENPCVRQFKSGPRHQLFLPANMMGRSGGIGRRGGLKNRWGKPCPGSSPGFGTKVHLP